MIFPGVDPQTLPSTRFGGPATSRRLLRTTWHITSVAFAVSATVLLVCATIGATDATRAARSAKILPWSHTIFSNLKAWLHGTFRGVSKEHVPRDLDEFVYRFNRRWRKTALFGFVLGRAVRGQPFP